MSPTQSTAKFIARPQQVAEELLEPILQFIQQAGISQADAQKAFAGAWKRAGKASNGKVRLVSLVDPQPYVDLVATWTRHADYLDKTGSPRELPEKGRASFASLVREVAPGLPAKQAIEVLRAYGNVEISRTRRVKLIKPFFHIRTGKKLAFEPSVRFLVDAARNVKHSLVEAEDSSLHGPRHFWRAVEARAIPRRRVDEFLKFVKEQSLTFLQDVDDWLAENARSTRSRARVRAPSLRVGLGLFTFGRLSPKDE